MSGLGLYVLVIATMTLGQRHILFLKRDHGGAFDAAKGIAVPGSTRLAISTPDGEQLAAWYLQPQSASAPVFLFFHGQGGGLVFQVTRWARIKAMGAGALVIAYRGYPGSTGSPSEAGLAIDARAAYDWLASRHKPERIVIHGHSLGSGVAISLAAQVPARALVLEAPFTAAVDVAAERFPWAPVNLLMFDQFRSREVAPRVKMPVIIVHGDADRVISVVHGARLAALITAPKQFVRVPGGGHNSLSRDGLYDHVSAFLARQSYVR